MHITPYRLLRPAAGVHGFGVLHAAPGYDLYHRSGSIAPPPPKPCPEKLWLIGFGRSTVQIRDGVREVQLRKSSFKHEVVKVVEG